MMITGKYIYGVKPVTIEYPEVREQLPANSRSRLFNDAENCISCYQCATACPVDCIYITATRRDKDAEKIIIKSKNKEKSASELLLNYPMQLMVVLDIHRIGLSKILKGNLEKYIMNHNLIPILAY